MWNKAFNNPDHGNDVLLLVYDNFEDFHQILIGYWAEDDQSYYHYGDKTPTQLVVAWQELPSYKEVMLTEEVQEILFHKNFIKNHE